MLLIALSLPFRWTYAGGCSRQWTVHTVEGSLQVEEAALVIEATDRWRTRVDDGESSHVRQGQTPLSCRWERVGAIYEPRSPGHDCSGTVALTCVAEGAGQRCTVEAGSARLLLDLAQGEPLRIGTGERLVIDPPLPSSEGPARRYEPLGG
jgi:hypothetical protein